MQTGLKQYRATQGCKDVFILTREIGDATEYVLITLWEGMDSIRRFAGPEPERAVYYPEDDRYFSEDEPRLMCDTTRCIACVNAR